jgi:hypothetical protein
MEPAALKRIAIVAVAAVALVVAAVLWRDRGLDPPGTISELVPGVQRLPSVMPGSTWCASATIPRAGSSTARWS